jgi:hypothetical protein
MSFVIEAKLTNYIENIKESLNILNESRNYYDFLMSFKNHINYLKFLYKQISRKYYNFEQFPFALLNYIFTFLPSHYLFLGQSICKIWEKKLNNNLKNKNIFLSLINSYSLPHKYYGFTVENNDVILFSNENLYSFSLDTNKITDLKCYRKTNIFIPYSFSHWYNIKHHILCRYYDCKSLLKKNFLPTYIILNDVVSSIRMDFDYIYTIERCCVRIYNSVGKHIREWCLGRENDILWVYRNKIYCSNRSQKLIEVYSSDGVLKENWEFYSDHKIFDNIIDVTTNENLFYILNGNNIIVLTSKNEFLVEYTSPYPLAKLVYYHKLLYAYSNTHNKLLIFRRYDFYEKNPYILDFHKYMTFS